ncbi:FYVE-domain-containing protein [Tilletiopsis washingtonensis]|uniref:RING-type E3 ubiquitin transferase n=1 Tax=Tilletiopsis washingtonensis TaxID=58919 RepID=A0A316Z146_9BASI|nr:FYVE-domain-containing protein [Tilletiopsis washingtonensis]PWN95279.1 FYVE-domain-containing protein [Tilletiopsis washingtonensis]
MRSADLAAASEFRVPTHEVPNRFSQPVGAATLREQNLVPTWQSDDTASECPDCQRRFTFFVRKHHCRRCGQIRCDRCSSHRVHLSAAELVIDPAMPEMLITESSGPTRICNACNADRQLPPGTAVRSLLSQLPSSHTESDLPSSMSDVSSRASELNECPVCSTTLATLGDSITQEEHVRACLETGGGGSLQGGRYLVYKLPDTGPIVGKECVICLEDLLPGMIIARLPCLCYFHRACIDSWFSRGKACPTHARTW